ncbi:non-ribosomal peptide synthetase [Chitinophaga agri]|uniref:Amino acid adenylation domain-containing protein n=1 Tax=Chitinophaga agri TaxID=2703787 RepID=A0A6B9ZLR5_9BACT|nr:non-ribosomal peptide synthetase [Chitinophaga agri]QHS63370.1 amino acid adenylation domain-containing protein [Chitinophaga agri]
MKEFIYHVFEQRVQESPSSIAIIDAGVSISYEMLNRRSNQLAHLLLHHGVKTGDRVAVFLPAGIRHVTALLGVFKSGGVYVPMDISFASVRLLQMLKETRPEVIITSGEYRKELEEFFQQHNLSINCLVVLQLSGSSLLQDISLEGIASISIGETVPEVYRDHVLVASAEYSVENPVVNMPVNSDNYIFYTSGSTGRGKGIVGAHDSLSHYIHWHMREWNIKRGDRISQLAPVTFDASLKDIFSSLASGATLCIPSQPVRSNMLLLADWLRTEEVNILQTVPSLFRLLTTAVKQQGQSIDALRYIVLAGEKLYGKDVTNWLAANGKGARISNLYGLTETTVLKTYFHIDSWEWEPGEVIPVGKAISNTYVAVINESGLCSSGELGDVYIKSPFISKGYLDKELTTHSLVQNPLVKDRADLVWLTGDVGRYRPDGSLEILGRRDDQVKISGVRIELDEVRGSILQLEDINQVELLVDQDADYQQSLICYYTGRERSGEQLRGELSALLNAAMLPSYYVWLSQFPLNLNGKVDRKALPRPQELLYNEYEAPHPGIERNLADLWQQVLGVEQVGRNDNFFNIGGSSLKAIQLISRIYKSLDVQLSIAELFSHAELHQQAALVNVAKRSAYVAIPVAQSQPTYPLSNAQKRLWLQVQQSPAAVQFNGRDLYRLAGQVSVDSLMSAFETIIGRHESLRTIFVVENGEPRQQILPADAPIFRVQYYDYTETAEGAAKALAHARAVTREVFDLSSGPLIRVALFRINESDYLLSLCMHHIISDEWSMQVLIRELLLCYNSYTSGNVPLLPALPVQYKDYACWQQDQLKGATLEAARNYWLSRFSGELPVLSLPLDHPRPVAQGYHGGEVYFEFSEEDSVLFGSLVREEDATLFMGLLSLVKVLLYRYTGQQDIVVGTPVAGRDHPDLEGQIGYFLNTLALRNHVTGEQNFRQLLHEVRGNTLESYQYQWYPFDMLVEDLGLNTGQGRSPLFDIVVILQNIQLNQDTALEMNGVEVTTEDAALEISKGDLRIQFVEPGDGRHLYGSIEYNTDLFDRERIVHISRHLQELFHAVVKDPEGLIRTLSYQADDGVETALFNSDVPVDNYPLVHQLFEQRALQLPSAIAVTDAGVTISYGSLNARSNQLAHLLIDLGVGVGDRIGLFLPAGIRHVMALLSVFKTGGVYVPMDITFAPLRLLQMLKETKPAVIITLAEHREELEQLFLANDIAVDYLVVLPLSGKALLQGIGLEGTDMISIGDAVPEVYRNSAPVVTKEYSMENPLVVPETDGDSYIFYTSGSTGKGKGIVGAHNSLSQYIHWHIREWNIGRGHRISQLAPVTFDASLKDILSALASGATLCVPSPSVRTNMQLLADWLRMEKVSILQTVPSIFRLLTAAVKQQGRGIESLEFIVLAGEKLYGKDVTNWYAANGNKARLSNLYGLTETTILKSCFHIDARSWEAGEVIPVGRAISSAHIAVINASGMCTGGELGDIYIRSPYISKGYLDSALTARSLVQNPLISEKEDLVWWTGDMGRYRSDGNLEILGRRDDQVKINGVRIELDEVRGSMLQLNDIDQVELLVDQDADFQQTLICYYTGRERSPEGLRTELLALVNPAMLPSYYVWLSQFPLNLNGKVDRKSLPRPQALSSDANYEAPHTGVEQELAGLWKQVLGVEQVGRKDSFFNIGGSSLKAIQLISRIYKSLDVQLSIGELFSNAELHAQAALISAAKRSAYAPIPLAQPQPSYPLSNAQKRIWVLNQLDTLSASYNISLVYTLEGEVNTGWLESAFKSLIARHESLRTIFRLENDQPRQVILPLQDLAFSIHFSDCTAAPDPVAFALDKVEKLGKTVFKLDQAPLMKVGLYLVKEQQYLLTLCMHHIIADEWSVQQVLLKELAALYEGYSNGKEIELPALVVQYKDFACWQQEQLNTDGAAAARNYWQQQFRGELPVLNLPSDYPRPLIRGYQGAEVYSQFDHVDSMAFDALLQQNQATSFIGVLALVNILLFRYTAQRDLVIGTPVAGREHPDLEDQIGYYVNTLAIRNVIPEKEDFVSLLANIKRIVSDAFQHQIYPFDLLVEELELKERDLSRSPLFDVMISMQDLRLSTVNASGTSGLATGGPAIRKHVSKFDLTFAFEQTNSGLQLRIEYDTDLFHRSRIERMAAHLQGLMSAVIQSSTLPVSELDYIPADEKHLLLEAFNDTTCAYPGGATLPALFEQQVLLVPDAVAVVSAGGELSYKALNSRANALAHYLQTVHHVQPGTLIGLLSDRNEHVLIAILGILKAGAAYVPMDPAYPAERISAIIHDSGLKLLLSDSIYHSDLPVCTIDVSDSTLFESQVQDNPAHSFGVDQPAYVLYTSGSTGRPKGVVVSHQNVVNYLSWANGYYFGDRTDNAFAVFTSIAFDLTVTSLLSGLLRGDKVYLYDGTDMGILLEDVFTAPGVRAVKMTPSHVDALPALSHSGVETVILGGEAVHRRHIARLHRLNPAMKVYNEYGPTETTVGCVVNLITEEDVRIGKPIANTRIYILDQSLALQPLGVSGELCIAGAGVAQGYLGQEDQTAARFIDNPYGVGLLYRTGDIASWQPDGKLVYYGRTDGQVKIRGYRIELGEIEQVLRMHPSLDQVAVAVKAREEDKYLVAYYTQHAVVSSDELRHFLEERLPRYMTPSFFVKLDQFPLTVNGKVDLNGLPHPMHKQHSHRKPFTVIEKKLAALWEKILDYSPVGLDDHFFEMGGHSLKAIQLNAHIYKTFSVKPDLKELFVNATLSSQSMLIGNARRQEYAAIPIAEAQATYPLSNAQKRLWMLNRLDTSSTAYNISMLYWLEGNIDQGRLSMAFRHLVERHESLRTVFVMENNEPRQFIIPADKFAFDVEFFNYENVMNADGRVQLEAQAIADTVFDLTEGPLMRVAVFRLPDHRSLLVLSMHHIISDEWSLQILIKETTTFYNAYLNVGKPDFRSLTIQYKDYSCWQQQQLSAGLLDASRAYWLNQFSGELPVLELPADSARPAIRRHRGARVYHQFSQSESRLFETLLRDNNATLFMGLLALVNTLLYRYSGQTDLIMGSAVMGRNHPDLEDQIGYYVNMLAFRNQLDPAMGFKAFLTNVRQTVLDGMSHEAFPFDLLIEELELARDRSRSPLFDVLISMPGSYDEARDGVTGLSDVKVGSGELDHNVSKFDLTFFFEPADTGLQLQIEYDTDLFHRGRIERMAAHLQGLMSAVIQSSTLPVSELDYIPADEKHLLLEAFNDTTCAYPGGTTLPALFEQQVLLVPDAVAVVSAGRELSYKALNSRANALAHYLQTVHHVQPGTLIGLLSDRNEHVLIAILGILKAGAAYVPMDPAYPAERISAIIHDSGLELLLSDSVYHSDLPVCTIDVSDSTLFESQVQDNPAHSFGVDQPAYVLYTSGSTGRPKGVVVSHQNVVNYLSWANSYYFGDRTDNAFAVFTSIAFDLTVTSLLSGLLRGDKVYLYDGADMGILLEDVFTAPGVRAVKMTPSHVDALPALSHSGVETVILGGETVHQRHIARLRRLNPAMKVYNEYGPTETTVGCVVNLITEEDVRIGKPIANTRIYILDQSLALQPLGVSGELCIAGAGVAQGYLGQEDQTAARFIDNPYGVGLLYRTGDIASWQPDGKLVYYGRTDGQVKIRGYRIELGEIEQVLRMHPSLDQVVVAVKAREEDKYLVAYYTQHAAVSSDELRHFLEERLPRYMTPSFFVKLDQFPLTVNGKVNVKVLPDPFVKAETGTGKVLTDAEKRLIAIWEDVLDYKPIGLDDNFFEVGGHSLKAIQVLSRIQREFGISISLGTLFNKPTLRQLSDFSGLSEENSTLVPLNTIDDSLRNIYFFSPLIGTPLIYLRICKNLNGKFNCYGLQDKGIDDRTTPAASLEEKTRHFMEEILRKHTGGKIVLFGFSYGAAIAYETAKMIEMKGYTTSLIIVDRHVQEKVAGKAAKASEQEEMENDFAWLASKLVTSGVALKDTESLKRIWRNNATMISDYKQRGKIKGDLIAFKSKLNITRNFLNMQKWSEYNEGSFDEYYLDGGHFDTIQSDANIKLITNKIIKHI